MSKLIGIAGPSGHGKSTSLRNLDHTKTLMINVANKDLPFEGSRKLYNKENKNYLEATTAEDIVAIMKNVSSKMPHIKYVVIDDFQYIVGLEFVEKALEKGFDKFSSMAQHIVEIVSPKLHQRLRDDLYVIILTHDEVIEKEYQKARKMKTAGKLVDQHITLEGFFTIVFFTDLRKEEGEDEISYLFRTRTDGICNSKSPMGMFKKSLIPNDLAPILVRVEEYFSTTEKS